MLSDTHAPRYWKRCPPAVARRLEGADLILHAGDLCRAFVLDELAAFAPVRAVLGNNDTIDVAEWGAPETLDLAGDGLRIFNPGSPTDRRRQPNRTVGLLRVEAGRLVEARIEPVD